MDTIKTILGYILGTSGFVGLFIESDYCTKVITLIGSFICIGISIALLKRTILWTKTDGRA